MAKRSRISRNADNICASDDFNNSLVYFEPNAKKFTYYPLPQVWPVAGVPKVEIEANNTVWLGVCRARRDHPHLPARLYDGHASDPLISMKKQEGG